MTMIVAAAVKVLRRPVATLTSGFSADLRALCSFGWFLFGESRSTYQVADLFRRTVGVLQTRPRDFIN